MIEAKAPRYFFPDEEPEPDYPWFSFDSYRGLCGFCGHADHGQSRCPNRPLTETT